MAAGSGDDLTPLIVACAAGDRAAFRRLYDAAAPRLLGVALRLVRRRAVAEEIVHDAFLQIWQQAGRFDPARGSGWGWVVTIVRNRALNVLRGAGRETAADDGMLEALPDPSPGVLDALTLAGDAAALHRCLGRLEGGKQTSILLAYVDGLTHTQIAEQLATPLGTVKAWIRRGLLELKGCLG